MNKEQVKLLLVNHIYSAVSYASSPLMVELPAHLPLTPLFALPEAIAVTVSEIRALPCSLKMKMLPASPLYGRLDISCTYIYESYAETPAKKQTPSTQSSST